MAEKESRVVFIQAVVDTLYRTRSNTFLEALYYYRLIQMEENQKLFSF